MTGDAVTFGSHPPVKGLAPGAPVLPDAIGVFRLASILIRYRLRTMRNAFRARGRGRSTLFATVIGVGTALAYVGLFGQAFSVMAHTVDLAGQVAVLALVTTTIGFGSLAARAASSEAVRAGSPENEFLLARPVSLHVAGRGARPGRRRRRPGGRAVSSARADLGGPTSGTWAWRDGRWRS